MPIVVTCPSCSTALKVPDAAAGKRFKCRSCGSAIKAPADAAEQMDKTFADEPRPAPAQDGAVPRREERAQAPAPPPPDWVSNRQTVGLAALMGFAGAFGAHKFILGKNRAGFIMLGVSLIGSVFGGLGLAVMTAIAMIEGIKYLRMSDAEFHDVYVAGDKAWL
jgi:TM2 domain-containing membrane protein YozV